MNTNNKDYSLHMDSRFDKHIMPIMAYETIFMIFAYRINDRAYKKHCCVCRLSASCLQ